MLTEEEAILMVEEVDTKGNRRANSIMFVINTTREHARFQNASIYIYAMFVEAPTQQPNIRMVPTVVIMLPLPKSD